MVTQLEPKPLESVVPNATESMLDLIRHFLFFNPNQRWSADYALQHAFFSEKDEPEHPVPVPDKYCKPITPLDLLTTPQSPYQICPDWNTDRPVSRYGRLCSAIKDAPETTTETAWLHQQSRPIYSSHQKIHPVSDRPNSSHLWNKYNNPRPSTPVVDHSVVVGHGHHHHGVHNHGLNTPKRYSDEFMGHTHRHIHEHLHKQGTGNFNMDRIPHYGSQLVKWAPPRYTPKVPVTPVTTTSLHYHQPPIVVDPELSRPESRRCRSPAPFSSQLMKHKYTTTSHTTPISMNNNGSTIKNWTPNTVPTEKEVWRKSDKTQSTHRNSTSHRFNLWVPETEEEEEEITEPFDRSVFLPMALQ